MTIRTILKSVIDRVTHPPGIEVSRHYLKIVTKGSEDKVLNRVTEGLKKISPIQLERSLIQLYRGGKTIEWLSPGFDSLGFETPFFFPATVMASPNKFSNECIIY